MIADGMDQVVNQVLPRVPGDTQHGISLAVLRIYVRFQPQPQYPQANAALMIAADPEPAQLVHHVNKQPEFQQNYVHVNQRPLLQLPPQPQPQLPSPFPPPLQFPPTSVVFLIV